MSAGGGGGGDATDRDQRAERRHHEAANCLKELGGRVPKIVHEETIRLMAPSKTEMSVLQRGLEELADVLGFLARRAT